MRQFPAQGTLSSYDKVTLVVPKALQGVVPKLVGLRLGRAEARLDRHHLKWKVAGEPPKAAQGDRADARGGASRASAGSWSRWS